MPDRSFTVSFSEANRAFTVTQDGESKEYTINTGVGPQGPAGATGPAGPNSVTSATTSDGTANLHLASLTNDVGASLLRVGVDHTGIGGSKTGVAEGSATIASGEYSHAEGADSGASGNYSHAEGYGTAASNAGSHAEGVATTASGDSSHAEGQSTTASGTSSHAEGNGTTASGNYSHAEGATTTASGASSHAEGATTTASGDYGHAEGNGTIASGTSSHAEGFFAKASGNYSHAEGESTTASGASSHAEGATTTASGNYSHAAGYRAKAIHAGARVMSDSQNADVSSTTTDQMTCRYQNGYQFKGGAAVFEGAISGSNLSGTNTGDNAANSSAAPAIQIKTGDFTAVVGGRYITESGGNISITDPAGTTAGQSYEVWIGSGTIQFNGTGTSYSASRFSIRRRYTGSAWATPAPTISDPVTFSSTTRPTSAGTGTPGTTDLITRADGDSRFGEFYFAVKTADTSRSSTTTFTDDPHLVLSNVPAGTYEITVIQAWSNADGTGGMKGRLNYTGTWDTANSFSTYAYFVSSGAVAEGTGSTGYTKGASIVNPLPLLQTTLRSGFIQVTGIVKFTTTGTLSVQWAQNASSATATTYPQGAHLTLRRIGA